METAWEHRNVQSGLEINSRSLVGKFNQCVPCFLLSDKSGVIRNH